MIKVRGQETLWFAVIIFQDSNVPDWDMSFAIYLHQLTLLLVDEIDPYVWFSFATLSKEEKSHKKL